MANWVVKVYANRFDEMPSRTFVLGAEDEDAAGEMALDAMGDCERADLKVMATPLVLPPGSVFEMPAAVGG